MCCLKEPLKLVMFSTARGWSRKLPVAVSTDIGIKDFN